jgi:signal transduction histidine kinase/ligand-binding sensor domain-containing protein/DNA-binding response OmpR family regulator
MIYKHQHLKYERKLFWGVFLFLLAFSAFNICAQEEIYFEKLTADDGLSQMTVTAIFQDSKGFLWFGTRDGLNRYDGYNFEVFRNIENSSNSICNNDINAIAEDQNGFIWVGTQNGLSKYNYTSDDFENFSRSNDSTGLSHQKVSSLLIDRKGRIWIGTEEGLDLFEPATSSFKKESMGGLLSYNRIIEIKEDSYGTLWIGTLNKGLIHFIPETGIYKSFIHDPDDPYSLSNNHVRSIFEDSKRNLWIGTRNGLYQFSPKNQSFLLFGRDIYPNKMLSNNAVKCIIEDKNQNLYIGTNEGLNILNTYRGDMKVYNPGKNLSGNLNHFFIYSIFIDKAGTIWFGTYLGGINYFNIFSQQFNYSNPSFSENFVLGSIGPMIETPDKLWIGTGGGGLISYEKKKGAYERFELNSSGTSFTSNVVKSMNLYGDTLFLATENNRLIYYNIRKKKILKTIRTPSAGFIQNMYNDHSGNLLFCIRDTFGLRLFDPKTGEISVVTYRSANNQEMLFPFSTCLLGESPFIRWVGTRYIGLFRHDLRNNNVTRFTADPNSPDALNSNHVSILFLDSRNNLWVGTEGGGLSLFNRELNTFKTYGLKDGLPNRNIMGILEDQNGILWISTIAGITKFDPVNGIFTNYMYGNGFPIQELSENSFIKLSDSRLVFGGNNGLVSFQPEKIEPNSYKPPIVITEFRLLRSDDKTLETQTRKFITSNDKVLLKHNQSGFQIQFTALNYIFPKNNQYAFRLEGFDHDWNFVGNQRMTTYTNLRGGNYQFQVKASNNDGVWNNEYTTLDIKILSPPWLTWYAYIAYFLIFLFLTWIFFKQLSLEHQIKIKLVEQENIEKIHQLRIRMFTNFSHELRTPLTLITGPVEDLLKRTDLSTSVHDALSIIHKNSMRLLLIVNQLMDFRKQESGKMQLKTSQLNIVHYVKEISLAFQELAKKQNIQFTMKSSRQDIPLWFDPRLLEKVFFNLLSNAFKNTPSGGKIEISLAIKTKKDYRLRAAKMNPFNTKPDAPSFIEIKVTDTGSGISVNDLERIFDPFYQVDSQNETASVGTGIGLSLSKGIVELHSGIIHVESTINEGSEFYVFLPTGSGHLKPEEMSEENKNGESQGHYLIPEGSSFPDDPEIIEIRKSSYTILVIEDNIDVRKYIRRILSPFYNVIEANNGEEGYSMAISNLPDLMISDIMMPGMNGLELCAKIKNDIQTSHIPIILLTALATFRQIKEGFEVGADDYITKPFNSDILKMKVDSLISNRSRLRKSFGKKFPFELTQVKTTSLDDEFIEKVYLILEKYLADSNFNIETLSKEIGMSRANLYRKVKSLTDMSPNELIKNYRLRTAMKYLAEKRHSISEVSYMVGFSTPAYFTNSFRKAYNLSPSEFIENGLINR